MEDKGTIAYKSFDFIHNSKWQTYLQSLSPIPTGKTLEKYKRKWYKQNIDPDFDIEVVIPPRDFTQKPQSKPPTTISLLGLAHGLIYLAFIPSIAAGMGVKVAMAAHAIGLVRDYGLPFSRTWWVASVADEKLHSLLFCLLFLWINHVAFWLIPESIMALLAIGHFMSIEKIVKSEDYLLTIKAKYEIMCGVGAVILIFTGKLPFLIPLLYWQFLRVKYIISKYTRSSLGEMREFGDAVVSRIAILQWPWGKLVEFLESMGRVDRDRPSFCAIM